jgi:hypothetical protein
MVVFGIIEIVISILDKNKYTKGTQKIKKLWGRFKLSWDKCGSSLMAFLFIVGSKKTMTIDGTM